MLPMTKTKLRRGIKRSFQVLLDPHKARLLELIADTEDKKATSLMREMAYKYMEENAPVEYLEAEAKDEEVRLNPTSQEFKSAPKTEINVFLGNAIRRGS